MNVINSNMLKNNKMKLKELENKILVGMHFSNEGNQLSNWIYIIMEDNV
jgi:hypothetical protein